MLKNNLFYKTKVVTLFCFIHYCYSGIAFAFDAPPKHIEKYPNGNIKIERTYENDKSISNFYYPNGKLKYISIRTPTFNETKRYNENSELITHHIEKGNESTIKSFYDSGKIRFVEHHNNQLKDGYIKEYYENGNIECHSTIKKGEHHGEEKCFYETGEIETIANNLHDEWHGEIKQYYKTGQIKAIFEYEYGEPSGQRKEFYKNGSTKKETQYNEFGERLSTTFYYRNNAPASIQKYINRNVVSIEVFNMDGKSLKAIIPQE